MVAQLTEILRQEKTRRDAEFAKALGRSPQVGMMMGLPRIGEVTRLDDVVFSGYHVFRSRCGFCPSEMEHASVAQPAF